MRVGIMQPYFFPYIGYFSLIKHTDMFILFDTAQFIRHGWIERNRIIKPSGGWQYFSAPIMKHSQKTEIRDIRINNGVEWKIKIKSQMVHYKKAPYYDKTMEILNSALEIECDDIVHLDHHALQTICGYLAIETPISVFSQMGLEIEEVNSPDEWALNICKALNGVDEYWNPPGGKSFFDVSKYEKQGINIKFLEAKIRKYSQNNNTFEGGLSIIDVMMYNSVDEINSMLDDYAFC